MSDFLIGIGKICMVTAGVTFAILFIIAVILFSVWFVNRLMDFFWKG